MKKEVREGYKMTELGEIPKEWKVKKLGDIAIGKGEYGIGASATEYIEGKSRYLRITDIGDSCKLLFNDIKGLDDNNYEKYILKEGDIVLARTGNTTGKGYVYNKEDGELVYAGFLIKYSINNNIAKHNFIKYIIQSKRYWNWVNIMSTRSGQPGINSTEYSNFIIQLPSLEEQEKIASILSTVDEEIDNVDALIEKNKELKKGLMQTLLTKGIGHTKFKKTEIGEIPEEWEVKKLCAIVDVVSGATPKTTVNEYWDEGNIYWATPTDITSNGKYISKTEKRITEIGLKSCSAKLLPKGSILMSSRATIGERCINVVPMATNQGFKSLICKDGTSNQFIYYYIDILKDKFLLLASGSTFLEISKKVVEDIKVALPSTEEQEKIASILSDVDKKIEEYENKKEKLEELKKGLMQQLLTGKIRVI